MQIYAFSGSSRYFIYECFLKGSSRKHVGANMQKQKFSVASLTPKKK